MSSNSVKNRSLQRERLGYPFLLIATYLFLDYARPQDFFTILNSFHLGAIVSLLLALTWVLNKNKDFSNRQTILFILFLALMAKSIPIARNNYWPFQLTKIMFITFFVYYLCIVSFFDSPEKIKAFLNYFVFLHIILAFIAIKNNGQGIGNFLRDENDFSLAINMVIPYSFYLFLDKSESFQKRIIFLFATVLFLVTDIITFSRGGFVGLIAIFFYFVMMTKKRIKMAVVMIGFLILVLPFIPLEYKKEIQTLKPSKSRTWDTGDVRIYLWKIAWEMFLDNPVIGVGAGNYPYTIQLYETVDESNPMLAISRGGKVSHSVYFTLIPELGIPGVIVFGLMVFNNFSYLRTTSRLTQIKGTNDTEIILNDHEKRSILEQTHLVNKIMVASMLGYLVSGAFLSVLYYPHFWILNGVMVASMNTLRKVYPDSYLKFL